MANAVLCTNKTLTSGSIIKAGDVYEITETQITLDQDGGTGGSVSPSLYLPSNSDQTVTLTQPTKSGYDFTNWSVTPEKGSLSVSGNAFTISKNIYYGKIGVKALYEKQPGPTDPGYHWPDGGVTVKVNNILYEALLYNNGSTHEWGSYDTKVGTSTDTTAYDGASNTNIAMNNSKCFTALYSGETTIWKELQNYRTSTGMNTWFIPSLKELETIRTGGVDVKGRDTIIETWLSNNLWSSSEFGIGYSWCRYRQSWKYDYKYSLYYKVIFFLPI